MKTNLLSLQLGLSLLIAVPVFSSQEAFPECLAIPGMTTAKPAISSPLVPGILSRVNQIVVSRPSDAIPPSQACEVLKALAPIYRFPEGKIQQEAARRILTLSTRDGEFRLDLLNRLAADNPSLIKGEIAEALALEDLANEGIMARFTKGNSPSSDLYIPGKAGHPIRFIQVKAVADPAKAVEEGLADGLTFYADKEYFRNRALQYGDQAFHVRIPADTYDGALRQGLFDAAGRPTAKALLNEDTLAVRSVGTGENALRFGAVRKLAVCDQQALQQAVRFQRLSQTNFQLESMAQVARPMAKGLQVAVNSGSLARGTSAMILSAGRTAILNGLRNTSWVLIPVGYVVEAGVLIYAEVNLNRQFCDGEIDDLEYEHQAFVNRLSTAINLSTMTVVVIAASAGGPVAVVAVVAGGVVCLGSRFIAEKVYAWYKTTEYYRQRERAYLELCKMTTTEYCDGSSFIYTPEELKAMKLPAYIQKSYRAAFEMSSLNKNSL